MKIRIFPALLIAFVLAIPLMVQAGNVAAITVAGITDKIPLEYNTKQFGPAGVYVELWKLWSKKTGTPVNYIITTPEAAEKALMKGEIDVIMGHHASSANDKYFRLIDGIHISDVYIYHSWKIPSVETVPELRPYRAGITTDIAPQLEEINSGISLYKKNSMPELIDASERGEIKIFIAEAALANNELKKNGLWRKFIQSSEPVFKHKIDAAVKIDNTDLLQLVASGFGRISDTERLVAETSWTGGNFKYRIPWGFIAAIIVIISITGTVAAVWWWNFQLHRKVRKATDELTILKEKAEAANVAKSRFLDNISHELRTPLTLILAPVEDAVKGKPLDKNMLEMIQRNSRNLLSLINDLLDISRINAGKMNLRISETDLSAAVRLYCAEMESAAEYKGLKLVYSLPDEPVLAFIDNRKFSRIISNFFSNSFKFTKNGGKIILSVEKLEDSIILKFSDTGSGIPAYKIDSVFNLFTQAGTEPSGYYGSTGIGLAMVKEIAELHGGTVTVASRTIHDYPENHGTEFSVTIPSGKKHFAGRDDVEFTSSGRDEFLLPFAGVINPVPDEHIHGNGCGETGITSGDPSSILIVEDNADMQNFLKNLLMDTYTIHSASNGVEALDILAGEDSIDLIISDIMMPEMDGHELIKQIRQDEGYISIPVLFLTARGDNFARHGGLELGAVDYITKPFNTDELRLRIKNQMGLKILRNSLLRKNEELNARLKQHMNTRKTPVSGDIKKKLDDICEFIKEHFTEDLNRDNIASAADMNSDTFSRMFNQHTGKTLPDYISQLRVNEAKRRLVETEDSITRICMDTGFDSIRTFNRSFRKFTGRTPGDFRDGTL